MASDGEILELEFLPQELHRGVAPEALPAGGARILQNVDTVSLAGRLRRGPGCARLDFVPPATYTVTSTIPGKRRDGNILLIYGNDNGDISVEPGLNTVENGGPLPLWVDVDSFVPGAVPAPDVRKANILWVENFDEDGVGVSGGTS